MICIPNGVCLVLVITPLNFSHKPNFNYKPIHKRKHSELCVKIALSRLYAQWGAASVSTTILKLSGQPQDFGV